MIEDALRDPDWVVAMQEELNNFTRNEVRHLVPRPNQNVVGTVTEPPKSLGPPTVVLIHPTLDNPAGAPDHLTSSVSAFFTLPKSVSPVTQILQHIGGTSMRKQLQQLILY
jgi:hypothetical protein